MRPEAEGSCSPEWGVSLNRISKQFSTPDRPVIALTDVSMEVRRGEFVCLLGPSGCGKSTLLNIVAGLSRPSSGDVVVMGQPVKDPVASLGVVFQRDLLLPWRTVLQNVLLQAEIRGLPKSKSVDRARELLAAVGLEGFADRYPSELSGGMAQRVAICRALLHDPDLLLMDEPFAALDAITRDQMGIELQRLWLGNDKTVLFVTHSIPEAVYLADRVLVFTPAPARIAADVSIEFERPRRLSVRDSPEFVKYLVQLRGYFESFGVLHE